MKNHLLSILLIMSLFSASGQSSSYSPAMGYEDNKNTAGLNHTNGTISLGTYASSTSSYLQTHSNHPLYFGNGNFFIPRVVLSTDGNLGINLTDGVMPAEKLEIKNGSLKLTGWESPSKPTGIEFTNNAGTVPRVFFGMMDNLAFGIKSYTTGLYEMAIKILGSGNWVGLGNETPQANLDIDGTIRVNALAGTARNLVIIKTDNTLRRLVNQPLTSIAPTDYTYSDAGMLNESNVGYDASPSFGTWLPFGTYHFLEKPLQLVEGSTIKNFTAYLMDNNGSGRMQVCLKIISNTSGVIQSHCLNSSADNATTQPYSLSADIAAVVNTGMYSYVLRVESVTNTLANGPWNANMGIGGVKFKIEY